MSRCCPLFLPVLLGLLGPACGKRSAETPLPQAQILGTWELDRAALKEGAWFQALPPAQRQAAAQMIDGATMVITISEDTIRSRGNLPQFPGEAERVYRVRSGAGARLVLTVTNEDLTEEDVEMSVAGDRLAVGPGDDPIVFRRK